MPKLIVERGTSKGQIFAFDQEAIIGQGPGVTLQIDDKQMAARHARIYQKKGRFFLEILEGEKGVSVNGTVVTTRMPILSGNKIRIGLTWFQFIDEGSGSNSAVNILAILQYYEIIEGIDRGGIGNVCKVKELSLDRVVILRIIPPTVVNDSEAEQKFQEVAKRMASLCHENICMFLDFGVVNKYIYYTMAWIEGATLDEKIKTMGKIGHQQSLRFASQLARGLAHAHNKKILHRDLNPKSIIITNDNNAVISDFGVAKFILEITGSYPGFMEYYSPEQCENRELDIRSDIYSLGVVLYQMLTGVLPFDSEDLDEIKKHHLNTKPRDVSEIVPSIPKEVSDIVIRCLEKNPEDRFAHCEELIEVIDKILDPIDQDKELRPSSSSSSSLIATPESWLEHPLFPWICTTSFSLLLLFFLLLL